MTETTSDALTSKTETLSQRRPPPRLELPPEIELHMPASLTTSPRSDSHVTSLTSSDNLKGCLRRFPRQNQRTRLRCNAIAGRKPQPHCRPTVLPTCYSHRDQQSFTGWCQFRYASGKRCPQVFKWTPPYFELCPKHQGHPDMPCYFLKLPLELRHEIFRYLLPVDPIGSSNAVVHHIPEKKDRHDPFIVPSGVVSSSMRPRCARFSQTSPYAFYEHYHDAFPMPLLDLLLINRQIYEEVRGLLYSTAVFKIDIRKDGTYMCGRRLLEPRRADGFPHIYAQESEHGKDKFLSTFDWAAVKKYNVDILVESWMSTRVMHMYTSRMDESSWDEEVEMYDIRDYVSVVVSGILGKSRNLCKLQVRLCFADFHWTYDQVLSNTKLVVGPFERLRNVRQPRFVGVFFGKPDFNAMVHICHPRCASLPRSRCASSIYSVPVIPTQNPALTPDMPLFGAYTSFWEHLISSPASSSVIKKSPIRTMFTEFKDFYSKLALINMDVTRRTGRNSFLHRARVAREQEDVETFRALRNELIQYWYTYLEEEERKKNDMNMRLNRMLNADIYPSHEWDEGLLGSRYSSGATNNSTHSSPVLMRMEAMTKEGTLMTGSEMHMKSASLVSTYCPCAPPDGKCNGDSMSTPHIIPQLTESSMNVLIPAHTSDPSQAYSYDCPLPTFSYTPPLVWNHDMMSQHAVENHTTTSPTMDPSSTFENNGDPGPSNKKRTFPTEFQSSDLWNMDVAIDAEAEAEVETETKTDMGIRVSYVGKGKGRAEDE